LNSPRPFNIRIFVAEGIPDGLRLVEKSNWVGLGIICPRGRYASVKKRDEFSGSGVYLLVGKEDDGEYPTLYIGEAETVRSRLDSHHAKKDFWQQAIIFTTKGDPLNKAEVQYLEARLVALAQKNRRCKLDNANKPQLPSLSESDRAQVDGYLDEMLSLLPVLGISVFEEAKIQSLSRRIFYWSGKEWNATGYETSTGFAVKKGSFARKTTVPSLKEHRAGAYNKRNRLIEDGVLVDEHEGYRFSIDHEFSSPSEAAAVVAGGNKNGRRRWKDENGVSLREHQEREVEA
jgi:hypothetical protein